MTKAIVIGAKGRMGQSILRCAEQMPDITVVAQINRGDDLSRVIESADVVIDFSARESTVPFGQICAKHKKGMLIGTTGHSDTEHKDILEIATKIPIVLSSNFSTGVNVLFWLTRRTAEILGPDYDLEIVETHHRFKKDAPSGTAKSLAQALSDARPGAKVGIHSVRGGDVVGDHTVIYAAIGERLELTHKASNRETFANGALRAAQWVFGKKPGLYDMQDVLGLR